MTENILDKIKKAGLIGRGGAGFPTASKWEMVKKAEGSPKYVICNASEGEIGVFKDFHILENHLDKILKGMALAMDYLGTKHAFINLNANYYRKLKGKLLPALKKYKSAGYDFVVYEEHPSYIGGEETALLNAIEGKRIQPRIKPPFPVEVGLFGKPTIINNVETFYDVALVDEGKFDHKRFFCVGGKAKNPGVFHLPANSTLQDVLKKTKNWPDFDFFVQVGGSASGLVLNPDQLKDKTMFGAGSIEIYRADMKPYDLLMKWFTFYSAESCGKCTPCREGTYQLHELLKKHKTIPWKEVMELVDTMEKTSFCALGRSIGLPVKSYRTNILKL
jgi:NADH:ubiquinone oxidoreductase subunit F (NADH-binding)